MLGGAGERFGRTKAELEAVRACLRDHHEEWNLYQWGPVNTQDGQTCMTAKLTRVLRQIAVWAASLPDGILSLDPWLMPCGSSSLVIRRSMESVRPVRRDPYPQVSILPEVRHVCHSPVPSDQSMRNL